jgi:HAD superfamily hydrolase (TIGR01509 family)
MIKLVIFDLWNTLIYKKANLDTYQKFLKKKKIKLTRNEFIPVFEKSVQTKKWKSEREAYKNLCKNIGVKSAKENVDLIMSIRDKREETVKTYTHSNTILKKLKKQGYKTGIISNISIFSANRVRRHTTFLKYADYKLFSYLAGTVKPDKKIYKKMLKKARVKPEEALMIGDNYENDVKAPRSLGMKAIHYKGYPELKKDLKKLGIII